MSIKAYRYDALLYFCNYVIAIFPSASIRQFFYQRVMRIQMAPGSHIMSGAWLDARGNFAMGRNSIVNQRCRLDNRGGISIGDNVSISNEVHLITADHDVHDPHFSTRKGKISIGDRVFIGSRATILPGVSIGEGAVVAACACVSRNVPAYAVVAGIPARAIRTRNRNLNYETIYHRHFF